MRMPERKVGWLTAAAAATLLAIVGLWSIARPDRSTSQAPAPQAGIATPAVATAKAPAPSTTTAATVAPAVHVAADVPPGVSPEQWAALQAQLRNQPDGPAELRRLGGYFAWSDALRRFREARGSGTPAAELQLLAQTLDDGLPERLRRSEVTAAEARQIESAVLEAIEPDPARRADQLERWSAAHLAPPAAADPRQAEFERRQSVIVAAWSAQPEAARDRNALARDLETLRRQTFGPGSR